MSEPKWKILVGDCRERLKELPDESVNMVWTSPPYFGLRDYGEEDQIGLEPTPEEFVEALVTVLREARRVLRKDGTLWLNLGDTYSRGNNVPQGGFQDRNGVEKHQFDTPSANMGGHSSIKPKDLIGIPWRVAFALQADGWYLRSDIIWAKGISGQDDFGEEVRVTMLENGIDPKVASKVLEDLDLYVGNGMPESVKSRPTKSHEYLFLFSKNSKYYYDHSSIRESVKDSSIARVNRGHHRSGHKWEDGPGSQTLSNDLSKAIHPEGKNRRSVWCIPTKPFSGAHFATAPEALVEPCIKAGCPEGGTVLDPFAGAGTTLLVAEKLGRHSIGIELNPEYVEIAEKRLLEYHRDVTAPWEEGYIPEEEPEGPEEIDFTALLAGE